MTTMIPPTEYAQILRTNSSPGAIVALLNEAEERYSPEPKRSVAKRTYPFWKTCRVCSKSFMTHNPTQARRNTTCSQNCRSKIVRAARHKARKPKEQRKGMICLECRICGKKFWRFKSAAAKNDVNLCGNECRYQWRATSPSVREHLASIAVLGRAGWTEDSMASYQKSMGGANNPAWKGGVTYFRKHGNYPPIKYVRCPAEFLAMARKDGYVMEHRLIVAQHMGRPLKRSEVVHHLDHDATNNAPDNLAMFRSNQDHKLYEAHGSPAPLWRL